MKSAFGRRFGGVTAVGILVLNVVLTLMAGCDNDHKEASAQSTPTPSGGPRVLDANNKLVGPMVSLTNTELNPAVALKISAPNMVMVVGVLPNEFKGNIPFYFTTADCSGQPYFLNSHLSQPHLLPLVGVQNNIAYGPRANSAPLSLSVSSQTTEAGCVDLSPGFSSDVIIADPIIDLSTQFTPPFKFVYP